MAAADFPLFLALPAQLGSSPGCAARIETPHGAVEIALRTDGARAAFVRLMDHGSTARELRRLAAQRGGPRALKDWNRVLAELEAHCAIAYAVRIAGAVVLRATPMHAAYRHRWTPVVPRARLLLSRFAHLRRDGRRWVLESPLSFVRIELGARCFSVLQRLARPATAADVAAAGRLPLSTGRLVLAALNAGGFLTTVRRTGGTAEDADRALVQWEFADLVMQSHSRVGRHDGVVGATYEFLGRMPPEPPTKRRSQARRIRLARPVLSQVARTDAAFTEVLERRQSVREFGATPITLRQVSELLYRAARVRSLHAATRGRPYAVTSRPAPSGGAAYPLEIYVVAGRCEGLPAGIYHYDPVVHALEPIRATANAARWLLADARDSQGETGAGQVLLVFSARFRRLTWKYRSIALATILKDVGALLQTMYLVATSMGLAPCAIGSGDSTVFGDAIGMRFEEESSVGEFLIGSAPARPPRPSR
jgi:SagB-type dehydrogenase family enzyme